MAKDTSWRFSKCDFIEQIFHGKTFHLSRQSSRFEDYGQLTRERARIPFMLGSMRCHVPCLSQMEGYIKRTWRSRYRDHDQWIDFGGCRHGCQQAGLLGFFMRCRLWQTSSTPRLPRVTTISIRAISDLFSCDFSESYEESHNVI